MISLLAIYILGIAIAIPFVWRHSVAEAVTSSYYRDFGIDGGDVGLMMVTTLLLSTVWPLTLIGYLVSGFARDYAKDLEAQIRRRR